VEVRDDYYGQDAIIGTIRLHFYFQRAGEGWRLLDEVIVVEDTRPVWKNTNQFHLSEDLDSAMLTFRKMDKPKSH
jgi:hypothetical protein